MGLIMKNKTTKYPLVRFFIDNKKYSGYFILLLLSALAMGLFQTFIANVMGKIVDYGLSLDRGMMLRLITILVILMLAEFIRNLLNYYISAHCIESIFLNTRSRIFKTITKIPISILEKNLRSGDIASRVNSDMMSLCTTIDSYTWYLNVYIVGIIALIMCIYLSPILTFVYIISLPISIFTLRKVGSPIGNLQSKRLKKTGLAANLATDSIRGLNIVKSYRLENIMLNRYSKLIDSGIEADIETEKINLKMNFVKNFFNIFPLFSILILSIYLIFIKAISPGEVIAFIDISSHIRNAIELSDSVIYFLKTGNSLAERLYEILDLSLDRLGADFTMQDEEIAVSFKSVKFSYKGQENIFNGLSFDIKNGERVAIVGQSGSGKSTIAKLLCEFYKVDEGQISIFGNDVSNLNGSSLWENIALVDQDAFIFGESIYNNIIYGKQDSTVEEVEKVLKDTNCWDFVSALPNGIHTKIVKGGVNLSGGQKQRLAIARALIKNAPLTILDEPTSALDSESEEIIQKAINNLMQKNTSIIITHRISSIKSVDKIFVIKDGKIVEQGNYDALMNIKGYFYDLASKQS